MTCETPARRWQPSPRVERARSFWHLAWQYAKFGTVGLSALAVHIAIFTGAIELLGLVPLAANFVAFGIAVVVSFVGHLHWTFGDQRATSGASQRRVAFGRFVVAALTGLVLNSLAVYLVTDVLAWPYPYAIVLMISVVPLAVFVLNKFWVFAPR